MANNWPCITDDHMRIPPWNSSMLLRLLWSIIFLPPCKLRLISYTIKRRLLIAMLVVVSRSRLGFTNLRLEIMPLWIFSHLFIHVTPHLASRKSRKKKLFFFRYRTFSKSLFVIMRRSSLLKMLHLGEIEFCGIVSMLWSLGFFKPKMFSMINYSLLRALRMSPSPCMMIRTLGLMAFLVNFTKLFGLVWDLICRKSI